ncbi:DgyrCDS6014 [Dimorphilus gyrociliatus]|uniref:Nuclear pore protein n=1 Tax=Dimorphilus gyrociliatus TaxID=2664684 RepID=A0A7I8VP27_9ANNE|nr:DgyrCDS6014 [Dimorphilus gyrociliatus]
MEVDDFADLANAAQQLTAGMTPVGQLPRVERTLFQIRDAAERLASKTTQVEQESKVKASLLLGSKGFDLQTMSQKLSNISSAKTFEPLEPVHETDIESFLKNERENALLSAIEHSRRRTAEEVEKNHWECLESEWEREKQKLLNALVSGQEALELPSQDITAADYTLSHARSSMNQNELLYAKQIELYNKNTLNRILDNDLVKKLEKAGSQMNDNSIETLWRMVRIVTAISIPSEANALAFRNGFKFQSEFIRRCLNLLEEQYATYLENIVNSNMYSAQRGGIPGTLNTVKSFLKVRLRDQFTASLVERTTDGNPVWPAIFYCLRSGDIDGAIEVASSTLKGIGDIANCLKEYKNGLGTESLAKLQIEYARSVKDSKDPFKRIVYCVIGRCDTHDDHSEVCEKIDDYLWLKLSQCLQTPSDKHDLSLNKLQYRLSVEFGENHFNAQNNPFLYFQVLFLTGQFEAAIEILARHEKFRCHAVHVAIALAQTGCLAVPKLMQGQLLSREASDEKPMYRLNLARLICLYTKSFESVEPLQALEYFFLLRKYQNANGESWFVTYVSELVTETREFNLLLGSFGSDGRRMAGAIDKFGVDSQQMIETVARKTEENGNIEEAVFLYDLAGNTDLVVNLLNQLLVPVVRIQPPATEDYTKCTQVLNELQILPINVDAVGQKLKLFTNYSDEIRKVIPDVLIAAMQMLLAQYKLAKEQSTASLLMKSRRTREEAGLEEHLKDLKIRAKALITYAGSLPYRLPGNTNAKLLQMEVLMN